MAFSPKSNEEVSHLCRTREVKSADDESNKWQHALSLVSQMRTPLGQKKFDNNTKKTSSNTELNSTSSTLFQFNRSVQTSKLITDGKEDDCTVPKDDTIKDETGYSACIWI